MSRISSLGSVVAIAGVAAGLSFAAGLATRAPDAAHARPVQQEGMDEEAMMQMWQQANRVGEHHKAMDFFVGEWDVTATWTMPGSEPQTSTGEATFKKLMDGRFIRQDYTGEIMGAEMKGLGLSGYNTMAGRYESAWVDNMSTPVYFMTGKKEGDRWVYTGKETDPMSGETMETRHIVTKHNDDHFTFTMQMPADAMPGMGEAAEGQWVDHMTIEYRRKGAGGNAPSGR